MKKIIIGNWKMNPNSPEAAENIFSSVKKSPASTDVETVIVPPAIYIPLFKDRGISLGIQNIHYKEKGSFTGEISAEMAKMSGCKYVLVGHSERREFFSESDELINKKIKIALQMGLIPVLCIGETKRERNDGETSKVIKSQLKKALDGVNNDSQIIIGYEPIWAIGSGKACKPDTALRMRLLIKKTISQIFSRKVADNTLIVYGGSANLGNCQDYTQEAKFNGLLVGGASLRPNEFSKMIRQI
jgi:triosephosphate isomerase